MPLTPVHVACLTLFLRFYGHQKREPQFPNGVSFPNLTPFVAHAIHRKSP